MKIIIRFKSPESGFQSQDLLQKLARILSLKLYRRVSQSRPAGRLAPSTILQYSSISLSNDSDEIKIVSRHPESLHAYDAAGISRWDKAAFHSVRFRI